MNPTYYWFQIIPLSCHHQIYQMIYSVPELLEWENDWRNIFTNHKSKCQLAERSFQKNWKALQSSVIFLWKQLTRLKIWNTSRSAHSGLWSSKLYRTPYFICVGFILKTSSENCKIFQKATKCLRAVQSLIVCTSNSWKTKVQIYQNKTRWYWKQIGCKLEKSIWPNSCTKIKKTDLVSWLENKQALFSNQTNDLSDMNSKIVDEAQGMSGPSHLHSAKHSKHE